MGKAKKGKAQANEKRSEEAIGPLPSYPYGKPTTRPDGSPLYHVLQTQTPDPQPLPGSLKEVAERVESALFGVSQQDLTHPCEPFHQLILGVSNEAEGTDASTTGILPDTQATVHIAEDADPEATTQDDTKSQGDTLSASTAAVAADADPLACNPNLKRDVFNRLMREGRWWDIAPLRDRMLKEAKASGMDKAAAQQWVYTEIDRLYPPAPKGEPPPEPTISPAESPSQPSADAVPGLYSIPPDWPPLPDNATLQAELGWVQSQRLAVVEERGNAVTVRLERASSPAPSKAALGWLETSIRSYAKYIEVAAKTLAGAADEAEATRRERMRLDDIRALLDEMHRDG